MKWIGVALIVLLVAGLSVIPRYLGPDDLRRCDGPASGSCAPVDAIIAVSGGDTLARADEAVELYEKGWAPLIIFSGAAADVVGPSNAEAMRRYAVDRGVAESVIATEGLSRTTAENAINTNQFLKDRGVGRVILVTSVYHQRRASLEFGLRVGDDIVILNHPTRSDANWPDLWWLTSRGWSLAVGELTKIAIFYMSQEALR